MILGKDLLLFISKMEPDACDETPVHALPLIYPPLPPLVKRIFPNFPDLLSFESERVRECPQLQHVTLIKLFCHTVQSTLYRLRDSIGSQDA